MHWPDLGGKCKRLCTDEATQCQHRSNQNSPPCSPPIMFSGSNHRRDEYVHLPLLSPVRHFAAVRYLPSPMQYFSLNDIECFPPAPFVLHQLLSSCIVDLHILMYRHSVSLFFEGNAPFQKETESSLHWMTASFHHNKVPLGNRFQLVWCHQGTLHHLQRLAGIILALAHRAGLHRAGAEVFGQHFGSLAARRKTAEDRILTIILNDLAALRQSGCQAQNRRRSYPDNYPE